MKLFKTEKWITITNLIAALALTGCTEYIEMKPANYQKVLIVDGTLTNEFKKHHVKLSHTKMIDEPNFPLVSGASVSVFTGDSSIIYIENDTLPGYYFSEVPFKGIPGSSYKLVITGIDINEDSIIDYYTSNAIMGDSLAIDSVTYEYNPKWEATAIMLWAYEPATLNYYNFKAWVNDTLVTDTLFEYQVRDDGIVNGIYIQGIPFQFLQDEKPDELIETGDTLTLEIENIDENYYNYLQSARDEYFGYNPLFGGLPANVFTNIESEQEVMGIFRVYTSNRASVVVTAISRDK